MKDEQIKNLKQKIGDLVLDNKFFSGGLETVPFGPEDIRRVRGTLSGVSERRSCEGLDVSRAGLRRSVADPPWTERLR